MCELAFLGHPFVSRIYPGAVCPDLFLARLCIVALLPSDLGWQIAVKFKYVRFSLGGVRLAVGRQRVNSGAIRGACFIRPSRYCCYWFLNQRPLSFFFEM